MGERHLGESVAAVADGHLTGDARDQALGHLSVCAECRREVEQHRAMRQRLASLAVPAPPVDVTASLLALAPFATAQPASAAAPPRAGLPPLERPASLAFGARRTRQVPHGRRFVAAGVLAAAALGGGATVGLRSTPAGGYGPVVTPGSLELTRYDDTSRPLVIDDPAPVLAVVLRR